MILIKILIMKEEAKFKRNSVEVHSFTVLVG